MPITHALFLMLILLTACKKPSVLLSTISPKQWKSDRDGCNGYRASIEKKISTVLIRFKGLSETEIIELLGRPDENDLYERHQKFYSYMIFGGRSCANASSEVPHKLTLRFTALGYVQSAKIHDV